MGKTPLVIFALPLMLIAGAAVAVAADAVDEDTGAVISYDGYDDASRQYRDDVDERYVKIRDGPSVWQATAEEMIGAQAVICSRLAAETVPPFDAQDREAVGAFYTARECRPLWVDERGPTPAAQRTISEIEHAADWGLNASDFKFEAIHQPFIAGHWSSEQTADAEFEMTAAILRYAHQAQGSRILEPGKLLSSYLDRQPIVTSTAEVLAQISQDPNPDSVLRSFQPNQDQFLKLKALLASLRSVQQSDEVGAHKRGPNRTDKITTVIANMEEWRWMPRSLGATHILVNIPSFSVVLTEKDQQVFEERVIVGTPSTQTPIFSKDMTTIVLRPEWHLPDSIKLTALLSRRSLERQGYVIKRNGRIVSSSEINWGEANLSEYEIYQPSGDDNALGLVKLLFPNKHSVYLHDTPSKYLFNDPVRLFSHGCMRVRNPQQLAQRIFNIDQGDDAPDVKQLVRNGPMNNEFKLLTPIPVHVGYFTVWVSPDGEPNYYNDYYGHQKRITLALADKWDQIDFAEENLAAVDTSALKGLKFDRDAPKLDSPMGLMNDSGNVKYGSGDDVGDLIRRSIGGF
jgi:murein L,D-transpeptidase YcbB/YkuD